MDQLVIVLTRNYSTALSVVRALGKSDYLVDLIISCNRKSDAEVVRNSKFIRKSTVILGKKSSQKTDQNVISAIKSYIGTRKEKIFLFPTDDYSTMLIDFYREELKHYFVMPYIVGGEAMAITNLMDKAVQAALARKTSMLVPKDWMIDLGEIQIPDDMVYPCFCKPIASVHGYKTEMRKCHNREELAEHLAFLQMRNDDRCVFVQEFINIEEEFSTAGVCIDQEIILPGLVKKSRVAQYETGVTLAGCVVPPDYLGREIEEQIKEVLRQFHYVGMFDMEILRCGDKYYFGEVNLRSGGPNFAFTLRGTNLPDVAVRAVLDMERKPEHEVIHTFYTPFVYEKVAWEDYINLCITKEELDRLLTESEDKLLDWSEDPGPGIIFNERMESNAESARKRVKKANRKYRQIARDIRNKNRLKKRYKYFMKLNKVDTVNRILVNSDSDNKKRKRVILISRNYCSLMTMIRSIEKCDCDIEVVRVFQKEPKYRDAIQWMNPEMYSKYISNYKVCVTNRDPDKLVQFILKMYDPARETLLIPCDDLPISVIDTNYDTFKDLFVVPNLGSKALSINAVMEKGYQKKMAQKYGLNVTNAHEIWIYNGDYTLPEGIDYPCFIKPLISVTSSKSIMQRCNSEEELILALNNLGRNRKELGILVEDFLEIQEEYALLGYCAGDKVVIPGGMLKFIEGGKGRHIGVAMFGEVISTEPMQNLMEQIKEMLRSLNFTGLFDVDLLKANGKVYFCELNLRFGASGYAITKSGVNLPEMMVNHMLFGQDVDENVTIDRPGRTFVSEKILLEGYVDGFLTRYQLNRYLRKADVFFVIDENDPEPYRFFKTRYKYGWIIPIYRRLKAIKQRVTKSEAKPSGNRKNSQAKRTTLTSVIELQKEAVEKNEIINNKEQALISYEKANEKLIKLLETDDVVEREKAAGRVMFELVNLLRIENINADDVLVQSTRAFDANLFRHTALPDKEPKGKVLMEDYNNEDDVDDDV